MNCAITRKRSIWPKISILEIRLKMAPLTYIAIVSKLSIVPEVTMSKDVSFTEDVAASLVINGIGLKERGKLSLHWVSLNFLDFIF